MSRSAEEAVLVAVMDGDIGEAAQRLREFLPGELSEFERQATMLASLIRNARENAAGTGSSAVVDHQ